jgi:hypothetical protein
MVVAKTHVGLITLPCFCGPAPDAIGTPVQK